MGLNVGLLQVGLLQVAVRHPAGKFASFLIVTCSVSRAAVFQIADYTFRKPSIVTGLRSIAGVGQSADSTTTPRPSISTC